MIWSATIKYSLHSAALVSSATGQAGLPVTLYLFFFFLQFLFTSRKKWTTDKKLLIEQFDEAWGPSHSGNSSNTAVYVVHLYEKKQYKKKSNTRKKEKTEREERNRLHRSQKQFAKKFF